MIIRDAFGVAIELGDMICYYSRQHKTMRIMSVHALRFDVTWRGAPHTSIYTRPVSGRGQSVVFRTGDVEAGHINSVVKVTQLMTSPERKETV